MSLSKAAENRIYHWARAQRVPGNRLVFSKGIFNAANKLYGELARTLTRGERFYVNRVLEAMGECLDMARQSETMNCLEALAIHLCFHNHFRRTGGRPWLMEVLTRDGEHDKDVRDADILDQFLRANPDHNVGKLEAKHKRELENKRRLAASVSRRIGR